MTGDIDHSQAGTDRVGVTCDSCDWNLTVSDVIERIEADDFDTVSASRISAKFGSLGEGHAYFNRGHRISIELETEEVEQALQPGTEGSEDAE